MGRHFHGTRPAAARHHLAEQPLHFTRGLGCGLRGVHFVGRTSARYEPSPYPVGHTAMPAASNTEASRYVVVVLPLVPVTPTTVRALTGMVRERSRRDRRARSRASGVRIHGMEPFSALRCVGLGDHRRRRRPLPRLSQRPRRQLRWPRIATKHHSRVLTARESWVTARDGERGGAGCSGHTVARVWREGARRGHKGAKRH